MVKNNSSLHACKLRDTLTLVIGTNKGFIYTSLFTVNGSKSKKKNEKIHKKQTIYNTSVQHHTQWRLLINLSFRCTSSSLGNLKLNTSGHSDTILMSLVKNNFIKKLIYNKIQTSYIPFVVTAKILNEQKVRSAISAIAGLIVMQLVFFLNFCPWL